jgi:3-methyl-2-oxobutanoate hydroxymethyltransferase
MSTDKKTNQSVITHAITIDKLLQMKTLGEKIAMLTCYDASFASLMSRCGIDILLVGDSLGMVLAGMSSTLPVTMEHMVYHTECVASTAKGPLILSDMPFGSYQTDPQTAYKNASRLLAAGAHMVKLEGGAWLLPTIEFLTQRDIPVCGHLGLTPQSVHALSGYKVQGKSETQAEQLLHEAKAVEQSGARLVVLEAIPEKLGTTISNSLQIPSIGIGAGPNTDGQVLVMHDMLGVYPGKKARFVQNFMESSNSIENAFKNYVVAVKNSTFPATEHCF